MELTCIIVDDEPPAQRILEKYISEIPTLTLVGKCNNAPEALTFLHEKAIDFMFLDINMPKMSGLDFLRTIKNPPLVILTTAYRDYALEGFELDVIDYLKKPIPFERFMKAVNKAIERKNGTNPVPFLVQESSRQQIDGAFIFVKDDKISYRIDLSDIFYVEAVGDYAKIVTSKKVYVTCQTMKKIETYLPANRFPRVHKSFIVAVSKINSIDGNILNVNGTQIPIGSTYRKDFFLLIENYNTNNN